MSDRNYQYGFSEMHAEMFNTKGRTRKAVTIVEVLSDFFKGEVSDLKVLDIGGSAGIIDDYIAQHCGSVTSIDIDAKAVAAAREEFDRENLRFEIGDAMALSATDNSYDVIVCAQIYEHVPRAAAMMAEIFRVLRPGGVCYFAASNRLMFNEPHYNLPFLSIVPRPVADLYLRLSGKGTSYHELHYTFWGLKRLVSMFQIHDYTRPIIAEPARYGAEYMLPPGSRKLRIARFVAQYLYWAVPGYIWLLEKPGDSSTTG